MGNNTDEETPLVLPPEDFVKKKESKSVALLISFLLMVVIGLGNKIFQKLQTYPMYNYPYFLSIYTTLVYIPLSFAYIWPMMLFGNQITKEQRAIPIYKFAIMGALDGIAGIMQTFGVVYISGTIFVLLTQSAIPISMVISYFLLKIKYEVQHFVGAAIVICGLIVVLIPSFIHPPSSGGETISTAKTIAWSLVIIFSCVPMTLSSVYKEKALGEQEIDVVYLNGWVAIFQSLMLIPLAIPTAYAGGLTVKEIPSNIWGGMKCYVGINTLPSDDCHKSIEYVNLYIAFNVLYNILIILILKYGSSNILWLAMTIIVPLSFLIFSLGAIFPYPTKLNVEDIIGLVIIMIGLVIYRFFGPIKKKFFDKKEERPLENVAAGSTIQDE